MARVPIKYVSSGLQHVNEPTPKPRIREPENRFMFLGTLGGKRGLRGLGRGTLRAPVKRPFLPQLARKSKIDIPPNHRRRRQFDRVQNPNAPNRARRRMAKEVEVLEPDNSGFWQQQQARRDPWTKADIGPQVTDAEFEVMRSATDG